eukprot:TRINITY_DN16572_c0_g1_i1.p1 TRINITY_DN16572_c0_g1~~TRINITY_DN16572_c0_g1_i1.p1  ORF type:complete len:470 (+),score=173.99 TRINITY_DN16572_c0_g1_i1:52-1461(+)
MASLSEQLAQPQAEKTNEGDIDQESIPPMYPIVPPGFLHCDYMEDKRTRGPACELVDDPKEGKYLVAVRDVDVGEVVLQDHAVLQVPWDLDEYLHTPMHGMLAKMKAVYGQVALDQGYVQVIARFLDAAKVERRSTKAAIWSLLEWDIPEEAKADTDTPQVAQAIHECIPTVYEGILSVQDIVHLIWAYDIHSLICNVGKGLTAVYPFARYARHHCRPNCVYSHLDHPEDAWASRVQYTAVKPIKAGERVCISYISGYQPTSVRRETLQQRYYFKCMCSACTVDPDYSRGFKCWRCDRHEGVISPKGDGSKIEEWECHQCGVRPDDFKVSEYLESERKLKFVKADKWRGLAALMDDEYMHYSHYLAFRKLDMWAAKHWEMKDGETTANMAETLLKCTERVFGPDDPACAQYHEFLGQVRHGRAEAHTAQHHYRKAYEIRKKIGQEHTYWAKKTYYMAYDKPIGEFMDGK